MSYPRTILFAAAVLAFAGCSEEPPPPSTATPQPAVQPAKLAADDPTQKMARAVAVTAKPAAAVELRYEILAKPEVGKATEVEIALIPGVGVESLKVSMTGMDGITLAGPLEASFPMVESGKPYKHSFSLLADRAGVFYVTVAVSAQMGGSVMGRTFSIPVMMGEVQTQQKATAEPPKDAKGQAIQPMKAEEKH